MIQHWFEHWFSERKCQFSTKHIRQACSWNSIEQLWHINNYTLFRICPQFWSFSANSVHTCTCLWTLLVSGHSTVDADLSALSKFWVFSSSHSGVFQRNCRGAEVAGRSMQTHWSDFLRTTLILQPESRLCMQCIGEKSLKRDSNSWYPLEKGFL